MMKITQIRNATLIIEFGETVLLLDPMLAPKGAIPALKYATANRRRNPLVELPEGTDDLLKRVTHCLITHCQKGHFDHLDRAGVKWLRTNKIPVYCSQQDFAFLDKKGLVVHELKPNSEQSFLEGAISLVPCIHGKGVIGKFMAHGYGYFLTFKNEPSLYIVGDTILSEEVKACIQTRQPDIVVIPAGGARFDIGGEIIMGFDEVISVGELSTRRVIANHLEALDHCPVTRAELRAEVNKRHWEERFFIPNDGETLDMQTDEERC